MATSIKVTDVGFAEDSQLRHTGNFPTSAGRRFAVLDGVRGLALLGIALANFPEFGLWTFLASDAQAAMPTAEADRWVRFLQYMLIDGKFYTIFSLLFGIGFSLILLRHSRRLFLRRMVWLAMIGFCHLMFLWSGDILLLYAVGGMLLTRFVRLSDRVLLWLALLLVLLPVGLDALTEFCGVDFSGTLYEAWWREADRQGITEENFATWLRDAHSYPQMFAFLRQGAVERMWEFAEGHRLPKVLGLFLMGYLIGKHRLYARLPELPLRRWLGWLLLPSLLLSCAYAASATGGHPWGATVHSLLYALSVIPLGVCYVMTFCLLGRYELFASPGRMALTNYIGQTLVGIFLFYGFGLGLGTRLGLWQIELVAVAVFAVQIALSHLWLRKFSFGPLEWLWRMLTYGRVLPIQNS